MNSSTNRTPGRLHLTVLAPEHAGSTGTFASVVADRDRYETTFSEIQRFRGGVYVADGFLRESDLDDHGRHLSAADRQRWHLALRDETGAVRACISMKYADSAGGVRELDVFASARRGGECRRAEAALRALADLAQAEGLPLAETGGLAVAKSHRTGRACASVVFAIFALCDVAGQALHVCAAGASNCSANVLKRMGGERLQRDGAPLPAHFDPAYNSPIELLGFDTRRPPAKFRKMVDRLRRELMGCEVLTAATSLSCAA